MMSYRIYIINGSEDWGMRAIKSVLVVAGGFKRSPARPKPTLRYMSQGQNTLQGLSIIEGLFVAVLVIRTLLFWCLYKGADVWKLPKRHYMRTTLHGILIMERPQYAQIRAGGSPCRGLLSTLCLCAQISTCPVSQNLLDLPSDCLQATLEQTEPRLSTIQITTPVCQHEQTD